MYINVSMLKSGIMVEGGITEDQAFYFTYRRSQIHLFLSEGEEDEGYTVFKAPISDDYQGKYQWLIGDNQKLTFSITGASEVGGINISKASEQGRIDPDSVGDLKIKSRFDSQSLSYQYFANNGGILSTTLGHMTESEDEAFGQGQFIKVEEDVFNLHSSYQFSPIGQHKIIIGSEVAHTNVDYSFDAIPYYCTDHDADCESKKGERIQDEDKLTNNDVALYINDTWSLHQDWQLNLGLRAEHNDYTKQTFVHPRASLHWFMNDKLTLNTKAGTYSRFPDIDTVLKKVGNPDLRSPKATHTSIGMSYQVNDLWHTTVDVYYKDLGDLARSLDEDDANIHLRYSNDMSGTAKGVEWVVNRELADGWYGWASISWSMSDRTDEFTNVKKL